MSAFFLYIFIIIVIIREFLRSLKASFSIICQYLVGYRIFRIFKVISLSFVGFFLVLFLVKLIIHSYI